MLEVVEAPTITIALEPDTAGFLFVAGLPAYNEEKTIAHVVLKAQRYADRGNK